MADLTATDPESTTPLPALPRQPCRCTCVAVLNVCHPLWQYWEQLGLMAGVYATGAGKEVHTSWIDWYRGPPGCARYLPSLPTLRKADALEEYVLQGWAPEAPLIGNDSLVTALGSCFADEIRIWLRTRGYRVNEDFRRGTAYPHAEDSTVPLLQCSAGLVNTFVLLQQFEWAFEGREFEEDLWCGARGQVVLPTEEARLRTRAMFGATRLFVITLGLAEVWFQRRRRDRSAPDGSVERGADESMDEEQVLWRAVPSDKFDPTRHGFRVSSVSENLANLRKIVALVRRHNPEAHIVFTLSPVPLNATFRGVSCVTANAASKSILRVAVDEIMRENGAGIVSSLPGACTQPQQAENGGADARLHYWPAYEMIKEAFADPYLDDGRHVKPEVVQQVLALFGKHYCHHESVPASTDETPTATFLLAAQQRHRDASVSR